MNILMLTNTYLPHVGGVANSVSSFICALQASGHETLVVAPTFDETPDDDQGVVRVPAIQHFNGSDFSYRLPAPRILSQAVDRFQPDIVHSHHPFLLGDTALRIAARRDLPLVFTHHTMYEQYTHYVPGDSPMLKQFAIRLATEYANLCDHIIAPSASIADILRERGVTTPITDIPTGIDPDRFACGCGDTTRTSVGIPVDATVIGHVGRLAPEKNLAYLADAIARYAQHNDAVHALIVGGGPSECDITLAFEQRGIEDRLHLTGPLRGQALIDAYHAMDIFGFASESETQGMVIAEAMAAGLPVVALDAPGAREVVRDGENGRLLRRADAASFAEALRSVAELSAADRQDMVQAARVTAESVSIERCTQRLVEVYQQAQGQSAAERDPDDSAWTHTQRLIEAEWALWTSRAEAAMDVAVDAAVDTLEQMTRPVGDKSGQASTRP